ncbi:MAG: alpha-L-fucosidase [Lachnospiraceae bacterium]|nr:alpha-L-fucosidase [Lachnospiraceae bacterium]
MTKSEYLKLIDKTIAAGRYKADWKSLSGRKTPDWYYGGKFGIFIHWGVYSVPGFSNEWYSRNMYQEGTREFEHHVKTYGPQKDFGYKDFIPDFTGSRFDAHRWIETFKKAGARFVVPVLEHHDGFAMYDTDFNRWNAAKMGPKRNVAGELKEECEKQGLKFCASSHRAEHYFFMNMGRTFESDIDPSKEWFDFYAPAHYEEKLGRDMIATTDTVDEAGPNEEWCEDWLVRTCELIDRYRPGLLYFDWWIQHENFKPWLKKLAAYYYNRAEEWGTEVTIDFKHNAFPLGTATLDVERGSLGDIFPYPWQTDTAIGNRSWGYTKDNTFKSSYECITTLIDVVSKNGMLLLNIGPRPDGTFTEEETRVLSEIGEWLRINGEGIYETGPYRFYKEGDHQIKAGTFAEGEIAYDEGDFRFTYKEGVLYAFQMKPSKEIRIKSLNTARYGTCVERVELLVGDTGRSGGDSPVCHNSVAAWTCDHEGLRITLKETPASGMPQCFKIMLK